MTALPRSSTLPRRRILYAAVIAAVLAWAAVLAVPTQAGAAQTIVSLTFDDGTASQFQADKLMHDRGMQGTFYLNSSRIGTGDYYMTWSDVATLAADGNEIGGHTAHHANLPAIDGVEARREICQDRVNLINKGYAATDFAYPFGAFNSTVQQMVAACGYNAARTSSVHVPETIPPTDPFAIHEGAGSSDLQTLKNAVMQAEQSGGGWVPIVFHQLCNACDTDWILPSDFRAFLDWLRPRAANGTVVERVQDVIGGASQPVVQPPASPPAPNGTNALKNASLETDTDGDRVPDCWTQDGFGSNTFSWSRTSDAHSGSWAERVDVTNYTSGDAKLLGAQDLGFCTPTVTPGRQYKVTAWYKSTAPVSFTAFNRDSLGAFAFWSTSQVFPASASWTQATWTTPIIPDGTTGLSFGLALQSNGSLTVDDLGFDDAAPTAPKDSVAPTVSLTFPAPNGTVSGTVGITASASDNVQIDHLDFIIDGSVAGTRMITPYTYGWNSRLVTNGTHTIAVRAVDTAGNTTTTSTITVLVANSVVNLVQNPSLETATGSTPTCWTLGGYGNNSFAWTRSSDAHTGSFAEKLDITSLMNGDRKLVVTQGGTTCPVAAAPGHSYAVSAWYKSPNDPNLAGSKPVLFAYYLNSAGSWIFWAQSPNLAASSTWRQGTWNTPNLPAGATALSIGLGLQMTGTVTMDDFSVSDNTPPPDTTPPTSAITCNDASDGSGCIGGYYNDTVQVALSATDDAFGSGVASIRYTTDGSTPTSSHGTVYSGAFAVTAPGATVKWRAFDNAGNAESVHTQAIQIDPTAPTSSISCESTTCASGFYGQPVSVSLDATDAGGSGLREIRYTTDGSTPTPTSGKTYLGAFALTSTTTVKYRSYDNAGNAEYTHTQVIQIDTAAPTSSISCSGAPCTSQPYAQQVDVGLIASDNTGGSGVAAIRYTTDGSDPTTTNGDTYVDPFTFRLTETTTVKYRAIDNAGNLEPINTQVITVTPATATTVTLTNPTAGSTVNGTVTMSATANDVNVTQIDFLVDGSLVGSATSDPFEVTWDSTTVADGSHAVEADGFASDGTLIASDTATFTVANGDLTPPVSTISCDGTACSSNPYGNAVSVSLSAVDDEGGSGVHEIRYTTDGSDPTASFGTVYSGTFSVTSNTTVKFRAFDNAGNAEDVRTQVIQVDSVAPTSSIFCGGVSCSNGFYSSAVSVGLAASDSGGSGVRAIVYTTDGSTPTLSNGTVFTDPFTLSSTTTVKYRAFDHAGNAEPVNSALIKVDTQPPATTIACNGGACTGPFRPGASIALSATDGESGVASTRYTLDGSTPTANTGTVYTGPFTLSSSATVTYRSFDVVGNAESAHTAAIQIDPNAPTVSLTAPNAGDLVSGTVSLTATAADDVAVGRVDFLVDGTVVGTATSSPYSVGWNSASVGDGPHAISAKAFDTAGNSTTSSAVSVTNTNNNLLTNPSLETATGSTPTCWTLGGYGTNTFTWARTSDAHSGSFGELLNITSLSSGDRKLVSTQDTGTCAPTVTPGKTYTVTAWYKSASGPVLFAYYRNSSGSWVYWAQSPRFPNATTWTRRSWTTPAVPAGASALSVGPGLANTGSITSDDIGLYANG